MNRKLPPPPALPTLSASSRHSDSPDSSDSPGSSFSSRSSNSSHSSHPFHSFNSFRYFSSSRSPHPYHPKGQNYPDIGETTMGRVAIGGKTATTRAGNMQAGNMARVITSSQTPRAVTIAETTLTSPLRRSFEISLYRGVSTGLIGPPRCSDMQSSSIVVKPHAF